MTAVKRQTTTAPPPTARRQYIAAVRYPDGRRELFHVVNAEHLADARELVLLEVGDVRSLLLAERT